MFFCGDRTFNLWKPGINIIQNQNARAVKCKDQDNKTHQENSQQEGI